MLRRRGVLENVEDAGGVVKYIVAKGYGGGEGKAAWALSNLTSNEEFEAAGGVDGVCEVDHGIIGCGKLSMCRR